MKLSNTKSTGSQRAAILVVGPPGFGKTTLAGTLPHGETLFIDAEAGTMPLADINMDVATVKSSKDLEEIGTFLKGKTKYKYIFIDSLSEIAYLFLKELQDAGQDGFKMWGSYDQKITSYIKFFRDLTQYTVVFTCLDSVKADGLEKIRTVNLPGQKCKDNLRAWFDIVLDYKMFKDEKGVGHRKLVTDAAESELAKDRSGKLDKYMDPDLGKILNKLLGGKA